jgi:hypothetical protein
MPVVGAIAERVAGILPVTWDALERDSRYGDALLRTAIDTMKMRVFGTNVTPLAESAYPMIVVDYVAKLVAIDLCNPGIDFWMSEVTSTSATGTNEVVTWVDRANQLSQLRKDLLEETRLMKPEVDPLIGFTPVTRTPRMAINTLDEDFVTPSPFEFPRPYRVTDRT